MKLSLVGAVCMMAGLQAGATAQLTWTQVSSTGPSARYSHSMGYDSQRGRSVLFGGIDLSNTRLGDTWEWDGGAWTQVATSGPTPRYQHAMAYDSQRGRSVLFGGVDAGNTRLGDTWEWDGQNWTQVATTGPTARCYHAMTYDSQRRRTVLFGGIGSIALGDTWEWDGSAWQPQLFASGPPARQRHAMAYDSQRGRTVLFGGLPSSGGRLGDTWEWDGAAWTQAAATGPAARGNPAMVYDGGKTVMFGGIASSAMGDTWEWDGIAWLRMSAVGPSRFLHAMVFDSAARKTLLFGGNAGGDETWQWNGSGDASVYGSGCGSPPMTVSPSANWSSRISTTAQASLTNIPSAVAFVSLGCSRTMAGPFPLPIGLAGFGMPGCDLLQSAEAAALPVTFTGPGTATFSLPIPNWPVLIGAHVYLQGWAFAPGVNPGHTIVSNGLDWGIGY